MAIRIAREQGAIDTSDDALRKYFGWTKTSGMFKHYTEDFPHWKDSEFIPFKGVYANFHNKGNVQILSTLGESIKKRGK